ncbi:MAG: hypothetical protein LBQ54_10190 [Planctomycetaceae bacterium]|nr:hypothetical protein [Planctomycetaceae bacterium]
MPPAGRDAAAGGSLPTPSVWSASVGKIFPTGGRRQAGMQRPHVARPEQITRSRCSLESIGRKTGRE